MIEQLKQDTPEWLAYRKKGIGSSDIPVIMGISPWSTIQQLWEEKLGLRDPKPMNYAMKIGKDFEAVALDIYSWETRTIMKPHLFEHPRWNWMRASLDGYNEDMKKGIEIKVPGKKTLEQAKNGIVPDHYYAQMQWQMLVGQIPLMDYVVLDKDSSDLFIVNVSANAKYQRRLVSSAKYFWKHLQTQTELPMRYAHERFR